jgi:hypothetical protein
MSAIITAEDGSQYIERPHIYPAIITVSTNLQVQTGLRVSLPGSYRFRLKALARATVVAGVVTPRAFLFRLGNADGNTLYTGGAVPNSTSGAVTDRVLDSLIMGTGQFPFPLVPDVLYEKGSQIMYEIEDISNSAPYVIYIAYIGADLIPLSVAQTQVVQANRS